MTDQEALELLRLIHLYVLGSSVGLDPDFTIYDMAEDLAMSMDVTSDEADRLRREIEEALA